MNKFISLVSMLCIFVLVGCEDSIPPYTGPQTQVPAADHQNNSNQSSGNGNQGQSQDNLDNAQSGDSQQNSKPVVSDQPGMIWHSYFQPPQGWKVNREDSNQARFSMPGMADASLSIGHGNIFQSRQKMLKDTEFYAASLPPCVDQQDNGIDRNCSLPSNLFTSTIGGEDAVIYQYFGTWNNRQQEVNHININHQGQVVYINLQGNFSSHTADLAELLKSLTWKLEPALQGPVLDGSEKGL